MQVTEGDVFPLGPNADYAKDVETTLARLESREKSAAAALNKAGKRTSPIMQGFASQLSDADMKNIAYWAGAQKAKAGFAKDKDLVALGEKIYRGGIGEGGVGWFAGGTA